MRAHQYLYIGSYLYIKKIVILIIWVKSKNAFRDVKACTFTNMNKLASWKWAHNYIYELKRYRITLSARLAHNEIIIISKSAFEGKQFFPSTTLTFLNTEPNIHKGLYLLQGLAKEKNSYILILYPSFIRLYHLSMQKLLSSSYVIKQARACTHSTLYLFKIPKSSMILILDWWKREHHYSSIQPNQLLILMIDELYNFIRINHSMVQFPIIFYKWSWISYRAFPGPLQWNN